MTSFETMLTLSLFVSVTILTAVAANRNRGVSGSRCESDEYTCKVSFECIPEHWRCDQEPDCLTGDDERNCQYVCSQHDFTCSNGNCIPDDWRCDGDNDCPDGSDERMCHVNLRTNQRQNRNNVN